MKKEKMKLIDSIISYVVAVAMIIAIPVLTGVIIYREFQHRNEVANLLWEIGDAGAEADSYEVTSEILGELYEEAKEDLEKLRLKYEKLIDSNEFNVQQIISDYDEAIDYYFNYESYLERNPDVSFEQYLQLRNPELYARLLEYGRL